MTKGEPPGSSPPSQCPLDHRPLVIETTAGQIATELARRGILPDQPVLVTIQPDHWLTEVRRTTRPKVIAAGWSDDDIDRIIEEERKAVQHKLK